MPQACDEEASVNYGSEAEDFHCKPTLERFVSAPAWSPTWRPPTPLKLDFDGSDCSSPSPNTTPYENTPPTTQRRYIQLAVTYPSPPPSSRSLYSQNDGSFVQCSCQQCTRDGFLERFQEVPLSRTPLMSTSPAKYRDSDVSAAMEVVWHGEHNRLFAQFQAVYGHAWQLIPGDLIPGLDLKNLTAESGWREMKDSAKVRFQCEKCFHGWTSMKGRVFFWIQLFPSGLGQIVFKLFGQQCQKCDDGNFYHAMWYPEEVIKVVQNLFHYVGHLYYGIPYTQLNPLRRIGKPRQQHNATLCQACEMGLCKGEWMYN